MGCLSGLQGIIKDFFYTDSITSEAIKSNLNNLSPISERVSKYFQENAHKNPSKKNRVELELKLFAASIRVADRTVQNTPLLNRIASTFLKVFCIQTTYSKNTSKIKEHKNLLKSCINELKDPSSSEPSALTNAHSAAIANLQETLDNLQTARLLLKSPDCPADNEEVLKSISCAQSLLITLKGTKASKKSEFKSIERNLEICKGLLKKKANGKDVLASFSSDALTSSEKAGRLGRVATRRPDSNPFSLVTRSECGGIPNRGNTCYLASSMQMMARFFPEHFQKNLTMDRRLGPNGMIRNVETRERLAERKRFQAIASPMVQLLNEKRDVKNIDSLVRAIQRCNIVAQPFGAQECAMEAMGGMLDNLQAPRYTLKKTTAVARTDARLREMLRTEVIRPEEILPADQDACTTDTNSMLRLQILNNGRKAKTIEEALKKSLISSFSEYMHRGRKVNGVHFYKFDATTLPDTLPVALNRFDDYGRKIQNAVKVGDTLTIPANYTEQGDKEIKYRLKGYVIHGGGASGGHYRAFFKEGDKWFHANDSSVLPTTERRRKSEQNNAYIYVYERIRD